MAARLPLLSKIAAKVLGSSLTHRISSIRPCVRHIGLSCHLNDATPVRMPALSPTMTEGTIVKWHKQEGEAVAAGDILCDIQTDKAVVSLDIEEEGILAKIVKPEDSKDVQLGTIIALMVEEGEDWQNVAVPTDGESSTAAPATPQASTPAVQPSGAGHHGYGPAVRTILDMYQLSVSEVSGTGPHGRLLKGDLLRHIKAKNLQPAPPPTVPTPAATPAQAPAATPQPPAKAHAKTSAPTAAALSVDLPDSEDIPLTSMRSVIARRLTESKTTIPHTYGSISCRMDNIQALRKELASDGIKVSVNDFIIKAVATALQRVPEVNAVWGGESGRVLTNIDVSVAVATDNGLITPIVKDAIGLGVQEISATVKELAGRARENKLKPEEFQGGTFTISNLGMFGISEFSAVINPPQACILAIGGSRQVLNLDAKPETHMTVTMSADGRIVDEFLASRFLEAFRDVMETPMLMLSQAPTVSLESLFAK